MRAALATVVLFCLPRFGYGADLLIQAGQSIPPGNWIQINGTTGYQPDYPGFDKFNWVPALKRACIWSPYRTLSTEPDHTLSCYSFAENNWIVIYNGHQFHDEHSCAGHNEGGWSVDPTTSMMYGPSCYSAGQAFDDVKTPVWRWDMMAQIGTAMLTTPGPIESINQMNSYFDPRAHKLVWFGGGGSNSFTFEYTPDTNLYSIAQATTGTAPAMNLRQPSVFYRAVDGKGYYLFGKSAMTVSNSVNSYNAATHTWALVTPSGTAPSARMDTACAYSTADDAALCVGGYDDEDPPGPHNLSDTWVLDFAGRVTGCGSPPCWVQLNPATPLVSFPGLTVFERMVYDPDNDTFLLGNANASGAARFIWAYRFNPGPNAGYAAVTPSVAYPPSANSLNRDISGGSPSLAQAISVAATSSTVYYARAEGGGPAVTGNAYYRHIYVSSNSGGTVTDLPTPSLYSSIAADVSGATVEANEPTIAVIANTPWVAWSQWNGSGAVNNDIVAKQFNGTAWVGGNVGRGTECTSTAAFCLQHAAKIIDANGTPTIAYVQATHTSVPYQDLVLVKQYNGTTWSLLGSYLNIAYTATNIKTIADHPSIASDGTANPWVAWTEYTLTTSGAPDQENYTNAKMYLSHWTGTAWVTQCGGTGNISSTTGWASNTSVTVMGGVPYVAFTERGAINGGIANDINKLYVRKCQGGAWSTVGSTYLNRDQTMGWVFRPEITNDGTNLWVTWDEQGNDAPWAQTYSLLPTGFGRIAQRVRAFVNRWDGTAWTKIGGTLNADSTYGTVTRTSIAMKSGAPAVAWGEIKFGSLRQIYAKQWNGTDWGALATTPLAVATSSLPPTTVGGTYSQTLTANGGTLPYNWAVTAGILPAGLSLNALTGTIAGTPTTAATNGFTVQVTDSASTPGTATNALSILINAVPAFTTASPMPGGTMGGGYSQALANSGGTAPFTWSISAGGLPAGLTIIPATGVISGTAQTAGLANFTARILDNAGIAGTKAFTITITANLTVTTATPMATGTVSEAYSQTLAVSGGTPPYTWAVTAGALPGGLSLTSATGTIAGTLTTAATSNFTVQATDSAGAPATGTKALSILVNAAPAFTTASPMPGGTTGAAYSQGLANSGGTAPFTWSISAGALPAGLAIIPSTGVISGAAQTAGLANFTARILDNTGVAGTKALTITIASNLAVTTATPMTAGTVSAGYSQTLTGSGGFGGDTWTVTAGTLPAGLALASSTGIISGNPTAAATSNFTVQATDAGTNVASKALAITINGNSPAISTTSPMAAGAVNMAYSQTLTEAGGTSPFTWSITAGALPAGLSLAASTGIISGTPTTAAASNFTVRVTDSLSLSDSRNLSITTIPPGAAALSGSAVLQNKVAIH